MNHAHVPGGGRARGVIGFTAILGLGLLASRVDCHSPASPSGAMSSHLTAATTVPSRSTSKDADRGAGLPAFATREDDGGTATPNDADGGSTFSRMTATYDANDLKLLREVERITGRSPGPETYELMRLTREGADVDHLRAFIDQHFAGSVRIKYAAVQWLSARQDAGLDSAPSSLELGSGGGLRRSDAFRPSRKP